MKKVFLLSILFSFGFLFPQKNYVLKKELNSSDSILLKNRIAYFIFEHPKFTMQYQTGDFRSNGLVAEKPYSMDEIEKIKAKLKGNYDDIYLYVQIGNVFKSVRKYDEAAHDLNLGKELAWKMVKEKPDSAYSYYNLGLVYFGLNDNKSALSAFQKAYKLDPKIKVIRETLMSELMLAGEFDKAKEVINDMIKEQPDSSRSYEFLPVFYLFQAATLDTMKDDEKTKAFFRDKTVEKLVDMSQLKNAWMKNKKDFRFELFYRLSEFCVMFAKSSVLTQLDSVNFSEKGKFDFVLDASDKEILKNTEKFLRANLDNKNMPNKYLPLKTLAFISLMKNDKKAGKEYFQKTIEFKRQGQKDFVYNASQEWDNHAMVFFTEKDTDAYGKLMIEKLTAKPGINPAAEDYVWAARYAVHKRNFAKAKEYVNTALSIYDKVNGANLILGGVAMMEGNKKEALDKIDKEYKINKDQLDFWMVAGIYSLFNNDADIAYDCFTQAKEKSDFPKNIEEKYINKYLEPVKK